MDNQLKACPFCGGKAEMHYPFHLMGKPGSSAKYHAGVRCTKCRCTSYSTTPPDEAIALWNSRAALASDTAGAPQEPVCWITKEQLEQLEDLTSDAWVYWCETGHVAESDEIALYAAPVAPKES